MRAVKALAVAIFWAGSLGAFAAPIADTPLEVKSPDGRLVLGFETDAEGMRWTLQRDGKTLVQPSQLGVVFAVGSPLEKGSERLAEMKVKVTSRASFDTTWQNRLSRRNRCATTTMS